MLITTLINIFTPLFCLVAALAIFSVPAYSQGDRIDLSSSSAVSDSDRPEVEKPRKMEFGFRYWVPSARASAKVADNTTGDARLGVELNSKNAADAHYAWQFTRRNKLKIEYTQLMVRSSTADFTANLMGGPSVSVDNVDLNPLGSVDLAYR